MTKTYNFYKNEVGWFIDIKLFPKRYIHHLAMVLGADILLEELAKGKSEVTLKISSKYFVEFDNVLIKKDYGLKLFQGAVYEGGTSSLIKHTLFEYNELWLCPVTLIIFGKYPKKIFYKLIN